MASTASSQQQQHQQQQHHQQQQQTDCWNDWSNSTAVHYNLSTPMRAMEGTVTKDPPFLLLGHSNLNQRLEWDLLLACLLTAGTGQTESNQFYRSDGLMMTESCGAQNKTSVSPDPDGLSPINGQQHNTKEERSSRQRGGSSPSSKLRPMSIITWLPSSSHNVIL